MKPTKEMLEIEERFKNMTPEQKDLWMKSLKEDLLKHRKNDGLAMRIRVMEEQQMEMETQRGKLLVRCLEKGLSAETRLEIAKIVGRLTREQGEQLARKVIDIINSTETEEEILAKVKAL